MDYELLVRRHNKNTSWPAHKKTMATLIPESDLMEWTGFKRRTDLINWLRQNGIPYLLAQRGRVCCTTDSVNLPLLINQSHNAVNTDDIEF